MGINKSIKQLVVRLTKDNMQRLATVMQYRTVLLVWLELPITYKEHQLSHHLPDEVTMKVSYTTRN